MARKKVVFVIVEGPSDDTALSIILSRIFDKNKVVIEIVHGDITADNKINPDKILNVLGDMVKKRAKSTHFNQKDFLKVIHLVDMDGAYIPDNAIVEDSKADKAFYSLTKITTNKAEQIIHRNEHKRAVLNRISTLNKVWGSIPYEAYYMSCNLDHVLYNKPNSNDKDKENDAYSFAKRYKDDIDGFLKFISASDFSVGGDYKESWSFIKRDMHSLERFTNFGLCFENTCKAEDNLSK